jgi:hypothetical protein
MKRIKKLSMRTVRATTNYTATVSSASYVSIPTPLSRAYLCTRRAKFA